MGFEPTTSCIRGKTFAANAGGRWFKSHQEQKLFLTFYSITMECEEVFCTPNKDYYRYFKLDIKQ